MYHNGCPIHGGHTNDNDTAIDVNSIIKCLNLAYIVQVLGELQNPRRCVLVRIGCAHAPILTDLKQ
jgi:hypothetical protein